MQSKLNLTGLKFNKLQVTKEGKLKQYSNQTKRYWICVCDCGNTKEVVAGSLTRGLIKSCGCLRKGINKTHGLSTSRIYRIWAGIHNRENPRNKKMECYKGIKVSRRWKKFENFYTDMGNLPSNKHQIDRINPYGNYEPSNCRWATPSENMLNQKRNYKLYQKWKESKSFVLYPMYRRRILSGWSHDRASRTQKMVNQYY